MSDYKFILPAMGEGIIEATITRWNVKEGDKIEEDEVLVEVATDKVDSEIPAPVSGKIMKLYFNEGDAAKIGETIALIHTDSELVNEESEDDAAEAQTASASYVVNTAKSNKDQHLSVFIQNYAKERDVSIGELEKISLQLKTEELSKEDIKNYILNGRPFKDKSPKRSMSKVNDISKPEVNEKPMVSSQGFEGNVEVVEMDRMRKLIADHMVLSKKTSPHVTSFIEADVTDMVNWRNSVKDGFYQKENQKLTFTPLFIKAVTDAIKNYPRINVSVVGDKIIRKKEINIGVATALTDGNLIVPVIKNTDIKNLVGLATEVNDLTWRARNNSLSPSEIKGGTFTITNLGNFDNLAGTPIINQPEVAILAVGAIKRKPAVVQTEYGETLGIRSIVILSLSYDHRVVDGALGGMFLKDIAKNLELFRADYSF